MRIKSGDTVVVISGKDKGKKGKVLQVFADKDRCIVEGVAIATKHHKVSQKHPQGGIEKHEASIHMSNVMPYDAKAGKGVRVGYKMEGDKRVRISQKTKEKI
ncbi:MAG: 50S ribosomal protein L24 [Filifactoraceae bacterium]